jgi:antirestriction protein ArdC
MREKTGNPGGWIPAAVPLNYPASTPRHSGKEGYYAMALHKLVHWTKYGSRLKQDFSQLIEWIEYNHG